MHPKKEGFLPILNKIKVSSDFKNRFLIEKGFYNWSESYLDKHSFYSYIEKIDNYFRLIENINIDKIEKGINFKDLEKVRYILSEFENSLEKREQILFNINLLDVKYYVNNQFLYSVMLLLFDLESKNEIDKIITYLTHWLEDIYCASDKYYIKNKEILDSIVFQDYSY